MHPAEVEHRLEQQRPERDLRVDEPGRDEQQTQGDDPPPPAASDALRLCHRHIRRLERLRNHLLPGDTPATLHARIQVAEHQLYPAVLARLAAGERLATGRGPEAAAKFVELERHVGAVRAAVTVRYTRD